jgi:hypothetical protein
VTLFFFSCAQYENDFRRSLIKRLIEKGHRVWHVSVGRSSILTRHDGSDIEFSGFLGFLQLIRYISRHSGPSPSVFIDSTGGFVPIRSLLLRSLLRGCWCFDIFDNLLYDSHGFFRLARWIEISILAYFSQINIVLSQESLRLFPSARHIDNAADTQRINRTENAFKNLLILSMFDRRFDFGLVRQVLASAPEMKIYLYGRIGVRNELVRLQLEELCSTYPNLVYCGEYRMDDANVILAPFGIGFTPYVTNDLLTEFINPDKYYMYLNSGMEVISTDVPQARRMHDQIHIVRSASEIVALVGRIHADPACRKNKDFGRNFGWDKRADDLVRLIQETVHV